MNEQKSLLAALLAAQSEINQVKRDGDNPHFRSKYATLDNIVASIRKTLTRAGLVVTNSIVDGKVVTTVAEVKSGESISSSFPIPDGLNAQGIGSALTYARRYNLCALLQITTGDDDDGNAATGNTEPAAAPKAVKAKPSETAPRVKSIDFSVDPWHGQPWSSFDTAKLEGAMKYDKAPMTAKHREAIAAELAKRTAAKIGGKVVKDI